MAALDDLAALVRDDGVVLGAAPAAPYAAAETAIRDRRARGLFADMRFTMQQPERSCHPETALRGARTVVSALIEVWQPELARPEGAVGRLPRYAWGDPYDRLRASLHRVRDALRDEGARAAVFVDHNMHVDRACGHAAGLTFSGKNTMAIAPGLGSFVALGAVITDAALVDEAPRAVRDGCGSCTLCIDACPTGALDEPGVLDATRCLSYWTQTADDIPDDVMDALGDRVYGCDICQDVCPWNVGIEKRRADAALDEADQPTASLADWLTRDDRELVAELDRLFVPGNDARWLRRNALVAVGNVGSADDAPLVDAFLDDDRPVLRRVARRASERIGERE